MRIEQIESKDRKRLLLCGVATTGIFLLVVSAVLSRHPIGPKTIPAFELQDLNQPERTVNEESLHGKIAVLNVWASWCAGCRIEHPLLVNLADGTGIPVFGLNYQDERSDALRWLDYFGDPYVMSVYDLEGRLGKRLGVELLPASFVVDAGGTILYEHTGPLDEKTVKSVILPLAAQSRPEDE